MPLLYINQNPHIIAINFAVTKITDVEKENHILSLTTWPRLAVNDVLFLFTIVTFTEWTIVDLFDNVKEEKKDLSERARDITIVTITILIWKMLIIVINRTDMSIIDFLYHQRESLSQCMLGYIEISREFMMWSKLTWDKTINGTWIINYVYA